MDYLTILATRSLMLFAPHKASHSRSTSVNSSPSTPTTSLPIPPPISMPIQSLLQADTDCAYFLLTHVLSSLNIANLSTALGSSPTSDSGFAMLGMASKGDIADAEVMVWGEIDKAKMFARELGEWFRLNGKMNEKVLERMAEKWGLGLKHEDGDHEQDFGNSFSKEIASVTSYHSLVEA